MIQKHADMTLSHKATSVLADWSNSSKRFVKVMPRDFKRMLDAIAKAEAAGLTGDDALVAAFESNSKDQARLGGG